MSEPTEPAESSQVDTALELLRSRIIDLTISPGSRIDETLLLRQFGLGRTPAREAVSRLAAEGFVRIAPGRGGTFVRKLDLDEVRQVIVAHQLVESVVGQLCTLGDETLVTDLKAIQQQYRRVVAAREALQITALNEAFHMRIAGTLHNTFIQDFAQSTHRHVRRLLVHLYALERTQPGEQRRQFELNLQQHDAIIDAFAAGDRATITTLLPAHARATQDRLAAILESATVPALTFEVDVDSIFPGT